MEKRQQVERSIIKKYKKPIWNRFIGGIKDYRLIAPGDRIAVCISGGKDSMLLAKCMQHLQLYTEIPFEVEYLVMDPGYRPENRRLLLDNAALLGLPVKVFDTRLFEVVDRDRSATSPCYLCARMRRGCLYSRAQELGCNKIALGHHFDDVIETVLMSMLYGAEVRTMMPKLHSAHLQLMQNLVLTISDKYFALDRRVELLICKSLRARISLWLLDEAHRAGSDTFTTPLTRAGLAEYLNCDRSALSRELSRMQHDGLIETWRSSFKLLDKDRLKNV